MYRHRILSQSSERVELYFDLGASRYGELLYAAIYRFTACYELNTDSQLRVPKPIGA